MDMSVLPPAAERDVGRQGPPPVVSTFATPASDLKTFWREAHSNSEMRIGHLEQLAHVGMLAGHAAHEIKNALVGVKTFVDLLAREHQGSELAALASAEIVRIQSLVSQMLQLAAKPQTSWAVVHLHDLLQQTIALVHRPLGAKRLTLETSFSCGPDTVHANSDQLKQAFLNVLLNAVDASHVGGTIQVRTRATKRGMFCVEFQDSGVGIRPENLPQLFQPFFTTKPEGTGLGLSITHGIIQEHNGTIEVASLPNEGSTFTFQLPLRA